MKTKTKALLGVLCATIASQAFPAIVTLPGTSDPRLARITEGATVSSEEVTPTQSPGEVATTKTVTAKAKTMSYTLQFLGSSEKDIHNPTEAGIRAALTSHKDDFGPIFEIHPDGTDAFFVIVSEQGGHFSFQYANDRKKMIYLSKKETFSIEDGVKAASEYLKGSPDWKQFGDWKELKQ